MRVAAPAFIIPWLFLWNPNMIAHFTGLLPALASITAAIVLIFCLQTGLFGYMLKALGLVERAVFLTISAILVAYVITQNIVLFVVGIVLFILVFLAKTIINFRLVQEDQTV